MSYFVICMQSAGKVKYLNYDYSSGGYPYWARDLSGAHLFNDSEKDREKIKYEIDQITKGKSVEMSNGTVYPNAMLHSGLDLSNERLTGAGTVSVFKISLTSIESHHITASIILK